MEENFSSLRKRFEATCCFGVLRKVKLKDYHDIPTLQTSCNIPDDLILNFDQMLLSYHELAYCPMR